MMQMLFNPEAPAFIRDPYRFYRVLQLEKPFLKTAPGFYVLTRDREVRAILNDRRFGRDFQGVTTGGPEAEARNPFLREPAISSMRRWMLVLDPPDHSRIRGLVNKAFSDTHQLYGGVPARPVQKLPEDYVYFRRTTGFVV